MSLTLSARDLPLVYESLERARDNPADLLAEVLRTSCEAIHAEQAMLVVSGKEPFFCPFATDPALTGEHSAAELGGPGALLGLKWKVHRNYRISGRSWILVFGGRPGRRVRSIDDVTAELIAMLLERVYSLERATLDELTGLPARSATLAQVRMAMAAARRTGAAAALLYLDLNRFKPINDTYGHAKGDEVLRAVATCMRECLREDEFLGRLGGDEFVALVPRIVSQDDASKVVHRLADAVARCAAEQGIELSVSAGVALYAGEASSVDEWMNRADAALYVAKRAVTPPAV